jgi:REP element-mobilizing transposase RayT
VSATLPQRKPNRLQNHDYSRDGAYFVTICAKDRAEIFGSIESVGAHIVRPCLTNIGNAVEIALHNITDIYKTVSVDCYVIMPNHLHLILVIDGGRAGDGGRTMCAPTVSRVVKCAKEFVTKQIGFSPWQKSFYDHIIPNKPGFRPDRGRRIRLSLLYMPCSCLKA